MGDYVGTESAIRDAVEWLRLVVDSIGAGMIAVGIAIGLGAFVRAWVRHAHDPFTSARLTLARFLALALEFQLAADILSTAIAPSWDQIGKLAAIAVIRTGLNFFLAREIDSEARAAAAEARHRDG
jgi:uncharacterized membrane protein